MKILYLAPFRDVSGWADAALGYVASLRAAGVDVVPHTIKFRTTTLEPDLPPWFIELENRSSRGCDVVIQHVLPDAMERGRGFCKNIGLTVVECDNITSSSWPRYLNLMDEVWVPCQHNAEACGASGVIPPIHIIPHAFDTSKVEVSYDPLPLRHDFPNDFIFYTIGEGIRRKNLKSLLIAFHTEFHPHEPVQLLIKTSLPGKSPEEAKTILINQIDQLKTELNLYADTSRYKRELIITDHLSSPALMSLHETGDCFVTTSHGDAWNIPCFTAMAMGKTPIAPRYSGFLDYLERGSGLLCDGQLQPVLAMRDVHPTLYTARQNWFDVSIPSVMDAMRYVFDNRNTEEMELMRMGGFERAYDFSYKNVGERMKEMLENS